MKRNVDMKEISDGRLYTANDMVKADCQDCLGCSACCRGMGESIVLDPLDIHRMTTGLSTAFEALLEHSVELNMVDGVILPNLKMDRATEACTYLNQEGRCSIHPLRPGICRMFPLGRYYQEEGFSYFLQIHECARENRSKVKVKKWLDTPELKRYEAYIWEWHQFLAVCGETMGSLEADQIRIFNLYLLKMFYRTPYEGDFYEELKNRLKEAGDTLGIM